MHIRNLAVGLLGLLLVTFLGSCTSTNRMKSPAGDHASDPYQRNQEAFSEAIGPMDDKLSDTPKMILKNAHVRLIVERPDSAIAPLQALAEAHGGYASVTGTYACILRVKSDQLDPALAALAGIGKVRDQRITAEDVTQVYRDDEIRLENAQSARKRYLELLDQAENVEAALLVEKELERLNETIDLLQGRMNLLQNQVTYATIRINLQERTKPGLFGYIGIGLYQGVKWLFVRN
ncbi:DUF4349 domain-containing protein [Pontibacter sp. G13]|uniref:DUF4349 domain-containing protein n=1 Tax=Pontibacter sp. G13 TaxID=3074898 RepID=UPI002889B308|nr:DUF4349 domain-containing protein [Pontibacter sp. G13]WNJ17920.1 DUF4349 domain-containing protein [Pontibacter sp. G13]